MGFPILITWHPYIESVHSGFPAQRASNVESIFHDIIMGCDRIHHMHNIDGLVQDVTNAKDKDMSNMIQNLHHIAVSVVNYGISNTIWYLQHNCVGDTIVYHLASNINSKNCDQIIHHNQDSKSHTVSVTSSLIDIIT